MIVKDRKRYGKKIVGFKTTKDFYKFYKETTGDKISYNVYSAIIYQFNEMVRKMIIEDCLDYKFPAKLGNIYVSKSVKDISKLVTFDENGVMCASKLKVDWHTTLKMYQKKFPEMTQKEIQTMLANDKNKRVAYFMNEHTDGHIFRFKWDIMLSNVKNIRCYSFKPVKHTRLHLAHHIKKNLDNLNYFEKINRNIIK